MAWRMASRDWNGDGVIDRRDQLIDAWMIQSIVDEDRREYRISRMVQAIREDGSPEIDNELFRRLCDEIRISMHEFEQDDITEIQRRLNAYDTEPEF